VHIASTFAVPVDPEPIFDAFLDPRVMRRCISGCDEFERLSDTTYRGRLSNEVAHVRFRVGFDVDVVEMERPRLVRAVLSGEDRRLGSSLKLTASLAVEPADEGSKVSYEMDLAIWGKLGRLGEPIIRRRSAEVERDFVAALRATFDGSADEVAEADGVAGPGRAAYTSAVDEGAAGAPRGVPSALAAPAATSSTATLSARMASRAATVVGPRARSVLVRLLRRLQAALDVLIAKLQ